MRIFAISDLHLTNGADKPMDIFGPNWVGHWDAIRNDWREKVTPEDIVLIAGDISWGMTIPQALADLSQIDELPGQKIIIRGNHDYWWSTYKKICSIGLSSIIFLQNNAKIVGDYVFCGTRGWTIPDKTTTEEDQRIYERELIRLEMSLKEASIIAEGREIIGMIHYPPFNAKYEPSAFTDLFDRYGVRKTVYGHLHGPQAVFMQKKAMVNGAVYYLTSCDFLHNKLIEI